MKNCLKCNSDKIVPNARVLDTGQYAAGYLQLAIEGDPNALFFKETTQCGVKISVCGSCGYMEFYAEDPNLIYQTYQNTLNKT